MTRQGGMVMNSSIERVNQLKKEKNAIILAHYYVEDEIQAVADYVGDSFYLSKVATRAKADTLVLCGVAFMGESAKILNPEKTVLMPDAAADCPMAHMATAEKILAVRKQYPDAAVVCYINSTAELKAHADVCVTSSNALKIVKALPNKYIYFIPDMHLAHYIAAQVPEKKFIFNEGYCPIHQEITLKDLLKSKNEHPDARIAVHPECPAEVTQAADFVGSTSEIIAYVNSDEADAFIIGTEIGVFYELKTQNPDKTFYTINDHQICPDMKKLTLEKVIRVLETGTPAVEMTPEAIKAADLPLKRMLELSK